LKKGKGKLVSTSERPSATIGAARLLFAADIAGTMVFAVEGAMAAVNGNLDLIGILVLAFCTALGGGIIRDVLLGALPPAALLDWRYPTIAFSGALLTFFFYHHVRAVPIAVLQVLDAAGLAIFAVAGTLKAMLHKMNPLVVVMLGTITGVGGGTMRDILLTQVPTVLRFEVYATAALFGSACVIAARKMRVSSDVASAIGVVTCFSLRLVSVWQHWNLPRAFGQ
jgi:uncharacterized membrane protein YeiH